MKSATTSEQLGLPFSESEALYVSLYQDWDGYRVDQLNE
jgi:hypothetical protein